jgi:hypothetical protein
MNKFGAIRIPVLALSALGAAVTLLYRRPRWIWLGAGLAAEMTYRLDAPDQEERKE